MAKKKSKRGAKGRFIKTKRRKSRATKRGKKRRRRASSSGTII